MKIFLIFFNVVLFIISGCVERNEIYPDVYSESEVITDTMILQDLSLDTDTEPIYEKGTIIPPNSLDCVPFDTGIPQKKCNHHGSTISQLQDGNIAVVWYHQEEEKSPDSRIVWSRFIKSERRWTDVEVLYDDPLYSEGNPAIWVDENGDIYVFFVTIFGSGWDETKIRMVKSIDNGKTFSEPIFLNEEYCYNTRHRPVRLENGDLLLPVYNDCLAL